jgi:radical SAM superfamily enzyme with C-terminal helix-hairpin-helix motif
MADFDAREEKKLDAAFRRFRELIRDEVDEPMLRKVFPEGTLLRNLIVESRRGDWSIARQIGTYPVAVNLPRIYPLFTRLDAFVTGCRERSLVGLEAPFHARRASLAELRSLPGLDRRAGELIAKGGATEADLATLPVYPKIASYLRFDN